MRPVYGPVLSVIKAAAYEQRLLTLAEVRAQLATADRGAALVTAPSRVVVIDPEERASRRRVEKHFGGG